MLNEEEVIRLFIKNGYQLSKSALPLVLSNPEQVISELGKLKPRPLFVTEKHIEKLHLRTLDTRPKLLKEYKTTKKKLRIEDYINFFLSSYEKIRIILYKRMDKEKLISINKITQQKVFSIIGIVMEKRENNLLLEDPSGEVRIYFDRLMKKTLEETHLDDVIGVKCKKIKDKIFARNVVYPDILSSRKIRNTEDEIKIIVVSTPSGLDPEKYQKLLNITSEIENLSTIFLFSGMVNERLSKNFSKFNLVNISQNSNPALFQINNIEILILPKHFFKRPPNKTTSINFLVSLLKRRNLFTTFSPEINSEGNIFILDEIPDIVISNLDESGYRNYKGATIISNSKPSKVFLIDLKTREVEEIII